MALYSSPQLPLSSSVFNAPQENKTSIRQDHSYLLDALNQGKFMLSVSPLLGCDYVFIKHETEESLLDFENIQRTLNDIQQLLSTIPKQTIFIGLSEIDNAHQFSRYDFVWANQNVESITKMDISENEQIDFMEMIYNCSTPI